MPVLTPSSTPPGVAVWPVGTVVLYAAALLPCRTNLSKRIQTPLTRATRFLHKDYKVEYFFWELLELNRRNALVGWVLLIPTEKTFLRLVIGLLGSIMMLTLLLSVDPYARAEGAPRSSLFPSLTNSALICLPTDATTLLLQTTFLRPAAS